MLVVSVNLIQAKIIWEEAGLLRKWPGVLLNSLWINLWGIVLINA